MTTHPPIENPFPGPQPYRAGDRGRFFGRDEMAYKLEGSILANRCLTVFGPSGAGKSSLVQASVIPSLIEAHDTRVVRVDGWPEGETPTQWLAQAVYGDLGYGTPPEDLAPNAAVFAAAKRAARGSPRPLLVYLDQIEQLLYSNRRSDESDRLFECVSELVELPLRNLRVVLSLREDYLGRFRDRLRDRRRILDHGFRVGPLTVAELTDAVCQAAAAGKPPQTWEPAQMRLLMMQVRVPGQAEADDAEAQSAYAQIVCRALFHARSGGENEQKEPSSNIEAEPIVHQYFETTLAGLGARREAAQRLLEEHLVTADGGRTLRTENELLKVLSSSDLFPILRALESAAILHAEEHQGSRYFELGHDWLAKKVFEERQARERLEEQRRREQEQQEELARQRAEAEAKLKKERAQRRRLRIIAGLSLAVAAMTGGLGFWALVERNEAQEQTRIAKEKTIEAQEQTRIAEEKTIEARDARIMAVFREMRSRGFLSWGIKMLSEVNTPAQRRGWVELASDALAENALVATFSGHRRPLTAATFSPDGKRVLTASLDGTARIYDASGRGNGTELLGHKDAIRWAAFNKDGKRIVTASNDQTARVWDVQHPEKPVVLKGHQGAVTFAGFDAGGDKIVTASDDTTARVWNADGSGTALVLEGHEESVHSAMFNPSTQQIITASDDKTVRIWDEKPGSKPIVLKGHTDAVLYAVPSPDGKKIVSVSSDRTARIWPGDGKGAARILQHKSPVQHAAWSMDGKLIATASADGIVRVWNAEKPNEAIALTGHTSAVTYVAFSADGRYVASASADESVRVWAADGTGIPLVLSGHHAAVQTVTFSPDGTRVLSSAADESRGARNNNTAKIWSVERLKSMPQQHEGVGVPHSAFLGADGQSAVSALGDNTATLWKIYGAGTHVVMKGHEDWVANAALSPDGKHIVTASFDQTLRLWNTEGKEEGVLKGHTAAVRLAVYSPDGKTIVSAADDKTARVWNADGTGESRVLSGHTEWLSSAAFSSDGKKIVTASFDGTARVWNADGSGTPVVLKGHTAEVRCASFSPDGKRVATGSGDRSILIWNADGTDKPLALTGHRAAVNQIAWNPKGTKIASVGNDHAIHVWELAGSRDPIILNPGVPVLEIIFIDEGEKLLVIGVDYSIRTYMIDPNELQKRLKVAHADCIPPDVRVTYLGDTYEVAWKEYADCEAAFGRNAGSMSKEVKLASGVLGASNSIGTLAKVVVLPGDAIVEVDGIVVQRRDGAIDLSGKSGDKRKLRVIKGNVQREWDVTIQETGASPPKLDLNERILGKNSAKGSAEAAPTLTPEEFQ